MPAARNADPPKPFTRPIKPLHAHQDADLKFQNALLLANQEASPDGILIVDENGRMISFNRRFVEMWGIPADVERSQSDDRALRSVLDKLVHPERFLARVRQLYKHREETSHDEIALKDGRTFERHTRPIRGPEGRYYGRVWHFRDISRRCRAESHLKESEERFRQLAENIRQAFWMFSADFKKVIYISPGYEEIWGRSCTSLYMEPSSWLKAIHPDDRNKVVKAIRPPSRNKFNLEYRIIRPNGSIRWINDRGFPVKDKSGGIYRIVGVAEDITDRREKENALRDSEERYRGVVDNIGIGVAVIDPQMRICSLNKKMQAWFPHIDLRRNAPLCYRSFNTPSRKRPCSYCPTIPTLRDGIIHEAVTETPTPKGIINYRIVASPIKNAEGRVIAAIEMVEDITARKKEQEALRESEERYRGVVDNIGIGVAVIGHGMKVLSINPKMREWAPHIDFRNGPPLCYRYFHTPPKKRPCSYCPAVQTLNDGKTHEAVTQTATANYHLLTSPLKDASGKVLAAIEVVEDITELKRAEDANALRKRTELQKEFIANISHEFRTPVAAIKGAAETLILGGLEDPRNRLKFAKTIERHADRLGRLVENLLDISSLESGKHPPLPESIALEPFMKGIATGLSFMAQRREVETRMLIPRRLRVWADRAHLEQIFKNLYENAIKYNREGGRILVRARRAPPNAAISIQDTGMGISPKDLPHIFERFYRPRTISARKLNGTGLGLPIAKQSIEANGGGIWVNSSPGKGSTFSFTLPLPDNRSAR